jgi:hypothetical protein
MAMGTTTEDLGLVEDLLVSTASRCIQPSLQNVFSSFHVALLSA